MKFLTAFNRWHRSLIAHSTTNDEPSQRHEAPSPVVDSSLTFRQQMTDMHEHLHRELMGEMRWRRDTEFKLLTVFVAVAGAALALLIRAKDDPVLSIAAPIFAFAITSTFGVFSGLKIQKEHEEYERLGSIIREIWKRWGAFSPTENDGKNAPRILPEKFEKFGMGDGYAYTLLLIFIVWFCCTILEGVLFLMAVCKA